jgi:alanine dehydrogenase
MSASFPAPVFVSAKSATAVFRWDEAVRALQAVYAEPLMASATPPRTIARGKNAWLRTLTAVPPSTRYFGAKLMGVALDAETPAVEYIIVLFDRQTSRIAALIDANGVTAYRTAATSAAALDRLAGAGAARLAVLGSGLEARMHTRAFAAVRPLSEIVVFSPTASRREAFARDLGAELQLPCRVAGDAREAVEGSTIVLAAARSRGELPILHGHYLKAGMTIVSIGSTVPEQREIDVSVVDRADFIVCDVRDEVLEESGDMLAAAQAGVDIHQKSFSLNALMAGELESQRGAARLPMFKSVGSGLQDVVIAELILTKAIAAGLATPLPIAFESKLVL